MNIKHLKFIFVSTPIGFLGSGRGGGVELTLTSLVTGLLELGHEITLVAPEGSFLPESCQRAEIITVAGIDQVGWQHKDKNYPMTIPRDGVLPKLWEAALSIAKDYDAIINFSYDWLPLWLTPHLEVKIFHLISMGCVSELMKDVINNLSKSHHRMLAFHSYSQASDYDLEGEPIVLGNGFDFKNYQFRLGTEGPLGWAGRVAPEKGLEDAVEVAASIGERLLVWGIIEDQSYASHVESSFPQGTIDWRGFLNTHDFQHQLRTCRAFINTPKWNEAYGNVVIEAMACGVPVVAYNRGGPGELVKSGYSGWLVPPDDVDQLKIAVSKIRKIDRRDCRKWAIKTSSYKEFARRFFSWIIAGIDD